MKNILLLILILISVSDVCSRSVEANTLTYKLDSLEKEISSINKWQVEQRHYLEDANERININIQQSDKLLSITSIGLALFGTIFAIMNIVAFIWQVSVQRNLRSETREINNETKEKSKEIDEKLARTRKELERKSQELFKQMRDSKYDRYDKKLMEEIIISNGKKSFNELTSFNEKLIRADEEIKKNDIRNAIIHLEILLKEGKELDYIYNRIGIAYTKIGASVKAAEYFEKAYDNASDSEKSKYVTNLLEQYIILDKKQEAEKLIDKIEQLQLDKESTPIFCTLKYAFYKKYNDLSKLEDLRIAINGIDWNQESVWDFNSLKEYFNKEDVDNFTDIYKFANITI